MIVAPASAQEGLRDMQPFALADMSTYGGGYRANQGFFFSFDGLTWWIGKPDVALIGDSSTRNVVAWEQTPGVAVEKVIEFTTHDTGEYDSEEVSGRRYNFGFIEEHHGWLCSILNMSQQAQTIHASNAHVVFDDAAFGAGPQYHLQGYIDAGLTLVDDLPVVFDVLDARYTVKMWGAELSYAYRTHPFHCGGILELYFGPRYLEFDDRFTVQGIEYLADPADPGAGLGDSVWQNDVDNHIIAGQVGFRWFRKTSRWTWSTEGRAFAGHNSQNVKLFGVLGTNLDPANAGLLQIRNMQATSFNHSRRFREFSPGAELRVNATYQLTRSVSLGVGWTGIWIDNIARAPGLVDYTLAQDSAMGIGNHNTSVAWAHGFNFTIELNR